MATFEETIPAKTSFQYHAFCIYPMDEKALGDYLLHEEDTSALDPKVTEALKLISMGLKISALTLAWKGSSEITPPPACKTEDSENIKRATLTLDFLTNYIVPLRKQETHTLDELGIMMLAGYTRDMGPALVATGAATLEEAGFFQAGDIMMGYAIQELHTYDMNAVVLEDAWKLAQEAFTETGEPKLATETITVLKKPHP
jgi:hypothetical protein